MHVRVFWQFIPSPLHLIYGLYGGGEAILGAKGLEPTCKWEGT